MPFRSEKQRKFMYANKPEIAKKWDKKYGGKIKKKKRKKEAHAIQITLQEISNLLNNKEQKDESGNVVDLSRGPKK